jgi:hypothetical protein
MSKRSPIYEVRLTSEEREIAWRSLCYAKRIAEMTNLPTYTESMNSLQTKLDRAEPIATEGDEEP